jgi:DNA-binding SARP family transcriptional activator
MAEDRDQCQFRILGPVQIVGSDGPLRFARRQHLDLVAFLLLHAERVVTTGQIIDAMWGQSPPRTAGAQTKNMLSALRGVLHPEGGPLATLDRQPAGYQLHLVSGPLDLALFTERVAGARAAGSPAGTVRLLRSALSVWQGAIPLAGVRAAFADAARAHLREQRDTALEELYDAELACGNHAKIVAALTNAVAASPGRERLVGQLMVALYRGGRVTDALDTFQRARRTLADDFGIEPSPELRDLELRILRADPALAPPVQGGTVAPDPWPAIPERPTGAAAPASRQPPSPSPSPPSPPQPQPVRVTRLGVPVPAQLPLDVRGFAGRDAELASLEALASEAADRPAALVVALMGMAGVGKTTLAVHLAHRVVDRFPDGQLYVDLRGFHPGAEAMSPAEPIRGFLDAFGVRPDQIPASLDAQSALYRSLTAGRRLLVVLDNALDAEQVRPLLPGTPGCLVLVTSRNLLTTLVAAEGAVPLTLEPLSQAEAQELLRQRLGAERVAAEPRAAEAIAAQCARLPLALALVSARAAINSRFPLSTLSARLSAAREGGDALTAGEEGDDVRAAFSWSYHRLASDAATLFRLLGLYPGPWVAAPPPPRVGRPGRFTLHDLLRAYARDLADTVDSPADRHAAVARLLDHYLRTAYQAALLIYPHRYQLDLAAPVPGAYPVELPDAKAASDWFAAEHSGLVAAVRLAADANLGSHAWQLASAMSTYLDRRGHWHDWTVIQRVALTAAEHASDRLGQAQAHGSLGLAYNRLRQYSEAHRHLRRAYRLYGDLADPVGQAYTHLRISVVADGRGEQREALHHAIRALDQFRAAGHRAGLAQALNTVGWFHAQLGQYAEAIHHCNQAVILHRELDDRHGVAHTLDSLGFAHHSLGDHRQAVAHLEEALAMLRELGDHYYESITLTHLGESHLALGDAHAARDAFRRARAILDELGHPDADAVGGRLSALGDPVDCG